MVVDKIENGRVFLRDPLPIFQGSSYNVTLEDFKKVGKEYATRTLTDVLAYRKWDPKKLKLE